MIPAWLLAKGNFGRSVTIALCPRCPAAVFKGLDDERAGLPARADINPIDEIGEALALIQGRATYDLVGDSRKKELEYRYEWHIRKARKYPVLAAHKCNSPLPTVPAQVPDILVEAEDERCPF